MAAKTGTRGRKSKSEVQDEFRQIKEELAIEKTSYNPKTQELSDIREAEIREAVKDISVDGIVQKLANMGIDVSRALSELSSKLVEQTELPKSECMGNAVRVFIIFMILVSAVGHAALPVVSAKSQRELLKSDNTRLAQNKKLAYDFFRIVLIGRHLDQVSKYMREDYIQHNPNVETGMKGFVDFFSKLGPPKEIPQELKDLVAIQAEGNFVTLSFVSELDDPKVKGKKYTTTWFDMFRFQDGRIAEHWDCDTIRK